MSENYEDYKDNVVDAEYRDVTNDTNKKKSKRKSSGTGKKIFATIGLAMIFGLVASFVFNASNMIVDKINGKNTVIEEEASTDNTASNPKEIKETKQDEDSKPKHEEKSVTDDIDKKADVPNDKIAFGTPMDEGMGNISVTSVVEEAMPSIVAITNKSIQEVRSFYGMGVQQYEQTAAGSGIIIGQNDTELLIVTNAHVVDSANTLTVCFIDEEAYEAEIKGSDSVNDLAIIAVKLSDISGDTMDSIKVATIGSSNNLKIGEQVVAIGNALGYGQSVTTGIVSALDRSIGGNESQDGGVYIQTDAAINPGNSGGALLNMKGELVGINSAKLANTKIEGMGYAIPIDAASPILENLMTFATRSLVDEKDAGYLGISGFTVTNDVAAQYNIPKGVYISDTSSGSAARMSGMQQGDVIVEFDGMSIDSINKLRERMNYYKAGEKVEVVIARADDGEYREKTLQVILGTRESVEKGFTDDSQSGKKGENDLPKINGDQPEDSEESPNPGDSQGQQGGAYNFTLPGNIFDIFGW